VKEHFRLRRWHWRQGFWRWREGKIGVEDVEVVGAVGVGVEAEVSGVVAVVGEEGDVVEGVVERRGVKGILRVSFGRRVWAFVIIFVSAIFSFCVGVGL
jgi:hypothetical protein